jgi:ABC-2 type transport system ATP-binding protein
MEPMLEALDLRKRFGRRGGATQALDGLSMSAASGSVLAILGPNGAGKTTFVRTVATLTRPDSGRLFVSGVDVVKEPHRVRSLIGLAGQSAAVEEAMTGRENVEMIARLFGHNSRRARHMANDVLDRLGLADAADRRVRGWSGGMRRRLDLGASLVGEPRVLLLDEPTTGLDPASRIALWSAVRDLVERGTDVVLTTQYLDEADQLADQIVIVDHGRVIATGTPAELKTRAGQDVIEATPHSRLHTPAVADVLTTVTGAAAQVDPDSGRVSVPVGNGTSGLAAALREFDARQILVDDLALRRPTLDDVFLALTGRSTDHTDSTDDTESERKAS